MRGINGSSFALLFDIYLYNYLICASWESCSRHPQGSHGDGMSVSVSTILNLGKAFAAIYVTFPW